MNTLLEILNLDNEPNILQTRTKPMYTELIARLRSHIWATPNGQELYLDRLQVQINFR